MIVHKLYRYFAQNKSLDIKFSDFDCYDIVSFDIFDTLLKRNVFHPKDIFSVMETEIGSEIKDFCKKRIEAERRARKITVANDVSLEDIYSEIKGLSNHKISQLISLEKKLESQFLTKNLDIFDYFKYCLENNKRVILISDMYLPKDFIMEVLEKEGIRGYSSLYVSSEVNETKSSGGLFQYVMDKENIKKDTWLHIGDSYHSDYIAPKKFGISAIHIPTFNNKLTYLPKSELHNNLKLNKLYAFVNNHIKSSTSNYYQFGYEKFGMFLWGYVSWLKESFKAESINKVYFFSRDGLIMREAFKLLEEELPAIHHEYLEVSRRSLRVPILHLDSSLETVIDMIAPSRLISLEMFFDGVGLNIDEFTDVLSRFNYIRTQKFDRNIILGDEHFRAFYSQLLPAIEENSEAEYHLLKQFIDENGISGKFAIVDIGWSGGMQRYLIETLDKLGIKNEVKGYYCGVANYYQRNLKKNPNLNLNGYLFDFFHDSNAVDKRSSFVGLFESLFLEQDGSVKKYQVNATDKVNAVRSNYEYLDEYGNPTFELAAVREIQKGALDFIKDIQSHSEYRAENYTADQLFSGLKQTGTNPTKHDLNLFSNFRFFDEGIVNELANPRNFFQYVIHPKQFKTDFLLSRWKIGFLKKTVNLPLPYEKIYKLLYNFK